jgi:hypothetical protein
MASWQIVNGAQVTAGNGMIATRDIQKGELIHQEDALVSAFSGVGHVQWSQPGRIHTFFNAERARGSSNLRKAVAKLNPAQRGQFNAFFSPVVAATPPDHVIDRFEYNAFDYKRHSMIYLAVYETVCCINHLCVPNADQEIDGNSVPGQARLIATRIIPNGSEILINYISNVWLENPTRRRQELQTHWQFMCNCEGCIAPAQIDIHQSATASVYKANLPTPPFNLTVAQRSAHILRLRSYIALMENLGRWTADMSEA